MEDLNNSLTLLYGCLEVIYPLQSALYTLQRLTLRLKDLEVIWLLVFNFLVMGHVGC